MEFIFSEEGTEFRQEIEQAQNQKAQELRQRAKNLYLRGRSYALRAIELKQGNFIAGLREDPVTTLSVFSAQDITALYWFSLSWVAAIAADKSDMEMLADLNLVEPIILRCLELDESFDQGALHTFMIAYQGGRSPVQGGGAAKARLHFARAEVLASDTNVSPLVSLAESVSIGEQNRHEFETFMAMTATSQTEKILIFNLFNPYTLLQIYVYRYKSSRHASVSWNASID